MKFKTKTVKEQRLDFGLGLVIYEMERAMWNSNKKYIAQSTAPVTLTTNMRMALDGFKSYCEENYSGK